MSSGVWQEKHENVFQRSSLEIIAGTYEQNNEQDREQLFKHLNNVGGSDVTPYNGEIQVVAGKAVSSGYTIIHARSLAEDVTFSVGGETDLYTGTLQVVDGNIEKDNIVLSGKSLIHSAALTTVDLYPWIFR